MRVALYLFRIDVARPTGVQRYALELAGALRGIAAQAGGSVQFWTGRGAGRSEEAAQKALDVREPRVNRRALHLAWTTAGHPLFETVASGADVVHLLATTVALPTRLPHVATVHDLLPLRHPEWFPRGPAWRFRRSVAMVARSGAHVIVPSGYVAGQIKAEFDIPSERLHVIPEGVDAGLGDHIDRQAADSVLRRYGLSAGRYVLAVGHLTQRKNLPLVASAVRKLPPDVTFVVVGGDGPGGGEVRGELVAAGGGRERLLGHLPDVEVSALLSRAGALAFPSLSEGFGLPVLEAMAVGAPVVAAAATSLPEVVGEAGLLADPGDEDAWRDALARVIEDADLASDLRRRGRERAAAYTWERAARSTWEVYQAAAGAT